MKHLLIFVMTFCALCPLIVGQSVEVGEPIPVSQRAVDTGSGIKEVIFLYHMEGDSANKSVQGTLVSGTINDGIWNATIPGQTTAGILHVYVRGVDNMNNITELKYGVFHIENPAATPTTTSSSSTPTTTSSSPTPGFGLWLILTVVGSLAIGILTRKGH